MFGVVGAINDQHQISVSCMVYTYDNYLFKINNSSDNYRMHLAGNS